MVNVSSKAMVSRPATAMASQAWSARAINATTLSETPSLPATGASLWNSSPMATPR